MRLRCRPLEPDGEALAVQADGGIRFDLWTRRMEWHCRDRRLLMQVIASEAITVPEPEVSEPVIGALARVQAALRGSGAVLVLLNPSEAVGRERIGDAEGVRAFAIANAADEACWDAALSLGYPVYGLRGLAVCEARAAAARGALAAFGYGLFTCVDGEIDVTLDEHRAGVRYSVAGGDEETSATVIVRGGFEAQTIPGAAGSYADRGNEGYVRLVVRTSSGTCWTQPRFIAPSVAHVH
jgi:hypothetical protein